MIVVCGEGIIDLTVARCGHELGYVPRPGGSPLNVAVGLARLGTATAFLGRLSTDRFGEQLRTHLETSGVDLRFARTGGEPTALAFTDTTSGEPRFEFRWEGTADRALETEDLPDELGNDVVALHVGSLSTHLAPIARSLRHLVERERTQRIVSYDPNIRPPLIEDRASHKTLVERWITVADVVKLSSTDLDWLHPHQTAADVALRWLALGPSLVVVTRGSEGAVAYTDGLVVEVPADPVQVVDTVGAGDAFTAGLLAGLGERGSLDRGRLRDLGATELRSLLSFAAHVAALTCTRPGADPPRREALLSP